MASLQKVNGKWRAQVNMQGVRRSRTFKTKAEAARWANEFEKELFSHGSPSVDITFE